MLDPFEATKRWKKLMEYVNKIQDPVLRESFIAMYQERAIKEWGFCPDKTEHQKKKENVVLEPWQQEMHDKLQMALEYGVWGKDEQIEKEAKARMRLFIERGGTFDDLPEDLQNQHIAVLYLDTMIEMIKYLEEQLDFLNKNT